MGLKPDEVERCTLGQFNLMLTGYHRRQQREWDRARHIMVAVMNFAGFGVKEPFYPRDVYPLDIDIQNEEKNITTLKQAWSLLKEFEE